MVEIHSDWIGYAILLGGIVAMIVVGFSDADPLALADDEEPLGDASLYGREERP